MPAGAGAVTAGSLEFPVRRHSSYYNPMKFALIGEGRVMKKAFLLLPFLAFALSASDVSGKWSGTIDIEDSGSTIPIQAELLQKSDVVSGKVGRQGTGDEGAIRNGKVDGTKVSFEVVSTETSGVFKWTLTLVNDQLEGEMKGSADEGEIVGKVKLSREKAGS
jgi:hypothetical protein